MDKIKEINDEDMTKYCEPLADLACFCLESNTDSCELSFEIDGLYEITADIKFTIKEVLVIDGR